MNWLILFLSLCAIESGFNPNAVNLKENVSYRNPGIIITGCKFSYTVSKSDFLDERE